MWVLEGSKETINLEFDVKYEFLNVHSESRFWVSGPKSCLLAACVVGKRVNSPVVPPGLDSWLWLQCHEQCYQKSLNLCFVPSLSNIRTELQGLLER